MMSPFAMDRVHGFFRRTQWSRIIRYLVAGGTVASINFALLYVLTEFTHLWYLYSSFIGTSVALLTGFILQKFWTFKNHQLERVHVQMPLHLLLSLGNVALNTLLLYLFVEWIHVWYMFAQFVIAGALACMNYFVYRTYIFTE